MRREDLIELKKILYEEVTKNDVKVMINNALDDFLKEKDLRCKIREIGADIIDDFFKEMWHKKGFWKNTLKNG